MLIFQPLKTKNIAFEKLMAIVALIGFLLVLFDLSYIPYRNLYFHYTNFITTVYDPVKGITPNRDTAKYLDTANKLQDQVKSEGLSSVGVKTTLEELSLLSVKMIDTDPFRLVGKSGVLEKIKHKIRKHMGNESAKRCFKTFWTANYLSKYGWEKEIGFYNEEIQPLIALNYYRSK